MFRTTYNKDKKLWYGESEVPLFNPNLSIGQAVLDALARNPHKIGQINDNNGIAVKNSEIRLKSVRAAQNLMKLGFGKNDVFVFYAKSGHQLAPVVFASLIIGAPVNPLDPMFKKNEISHMIQLTKPAAIFCDAQNLSNLEDALAHLQMKVQIFVFGDTTESGVRSVDELFEETGNESYFVPPDIGDGTKQIAAILCSSGTTGLSKGVCLSHAALLYQLGLLKYSADDVLLTFSSIYWISGFGFLIAGTLRECLRVVTTDPFTPSLLLKMVQKYKVTSMITAPAHLAAILQHPDLETTDLSSLWFYMCAGSAVHQQLCDQMQKHLPNGSVYVTYGMSEAAGIISINYPEPRANSVGQVACFINMQVLDEDGNKCGVDQSGEICLKMRYPFLGYYGNETETRNTVDKDGFIHSGDVGYFDKDGYLYLVDRKKDILKYKNYQISPSEVEDIILRLKGVRNCCVVGIPDIECTDLPAAVVMKRDGADITQQDVYNIVADNLSDAKRLRGGVYFVESLPMTPSGKVRRKDVREIARELYNNRRNAIIDESRDTSCECCTIM